MRLPVHLPLLLMGFLLIACTGENRDSTQLQENETVAAAYETPGEFRQQLSSALNSYFDLKDALVESDAGKASTLAGALQDSLGEIREDNLSSGAADIWNRQAEIMVDNSRKIGRLSDVEEQREAFEPLSMAFIQSVEAFGPFENVIYQQTCPMVGDGSADWLSASEDIKNPYHGDRMLRCGAIVRSF